jgi:hypothetical protein
VNADIVGTWHKLDLDGTPYSEVTFRPDKTYESLRLAGPENERVKYRGTYEISPGGRSINFYEPPEVLRHLPDGTPIWDNAINFSDRDHFRIDKRSWHHRVRDSYQRIK